MKTEASFNPLAHLSVTSAAAYVEPRLLLHLPEVLCTAPPGLGPHAIAAPDGGTRLKQRGRRVELLKHLREWDKAVVADQPGLIDTAACGMQPSIEVTKRQLMHEVSSSQRPQGTGSACLCANKL